MHWRTAIVLGIHFAGTCPGLNLATGPQSGGLIFAERCKCEIFLSLQLDARSAVHAGQGAKLVGTGGGTIEHSA